MNIWNKGRGEFWTFFLECIKENIWLDILWIRRCNQTYLQTETWLLTFNDRSAAKSLSSTILPFWLRCKEWLLVVGDDWPLLSDVGSEAASSFTLSAYLKVFNECSQEDIPGLIIAICVKFEERENTINTKLPRLTTKRSKTRIRAEYYEVRTIHVLDLSPINESLRTCVNLLALNGRWEPFLPSALMHSFNASKLLLISAPSIPAGETINGSTLMVELHKKRGKHDKNTNEIAAHLFVDWKTACQHHVRYRLSRLMRIFRELY